MDILNVAIYTLIFESLKYIGTLPQMIDDDFRQYRQRYG